MFSAQAGFSSCPAALDLQISPPALLSALPGSYQGQAVIEMIDSIRSSSYHVASWLDADSRAEAQHSLLVFSARHQGQ